MRSNPRIRWEFRMETNSTRAGVLGRTTTFSRHAWVRFASRGYRNHDRRDDHAGGQGDDLDSREMMRR